MKTSKSSVLRGKSGWQTHDWSARKSWQTESHL